MDQHDDPALDLHRVLVWRDTCDSSGRSWRAAQVNADHEFVMAGRDEGEHVVRAGGWSVREWTRCLSFEETLILHKLLHVELRGDLIAAVERRFADAETLVGFLTNAAIPGELWARRGS